MSKFLTILSTYFLILLVLYLIINAIGFKIYLNYLPQKRNSCTIFFDTTHKAHRIAIIGCSNIEHNLEFSDIRKSQKDYAIDFYMFNGNALFSYINFIKSKNILQVDNYSDFVLYLPYSVYNQSQTIPHHWGWNECFASKDYLHFLINKSPFLRFTEPWFLHISDARNKKLFLIHDTANFNITYSSRTKYIDSLITQKSSYYNCTYHFNPFEFINKTDPNEIYKLNYMLHNKTFIFLPPVPNIEENLNYDLNKKKSHFFEIINPYPNSIKDSSLFYDQWWHLNYKGRQIETRELIESLNKSVVR